MDNWEEKIRNGGDVPASEFTSVKEMINSFIIFSSIWT
jgi:hypothetical protein